MSPRLWPPRQREQERRAGFWAAGVWVYVFWNLFSLVGAVAGQFVADPGAWGLDAAAAAAFIALLWPRLRSRRGGRGRRRRRLHGAGGHTLSALRAPGAGRRAGGGGRGAAATARARCSPGRAPGGLGPLPGAPTAYEEMMTMLWIAVIAASVLSFGAEVGGLPGPAGRAGAARGSPGSRPAADRPAGCAGRHADAPTSGTRSCSMRAWRISVAAVVLLVLRAPFLMVVIGAAGRGGGCGRWAGPDQAAVPRSGSTNPARPTPVRRWPVGSPSGRPCGHAARHRPGRGGTMRVQSCSPRPGSWCGRPRTRSADPRRRHRQGARTAGRGDRRRCRREPPARSPRWSAAAE